MGVIDKAKYLWKFVPFGDFSKKRDEYRIEFLYAHNRVSAQTLGTVHDRDMVLDHERKYHRMAVAEKLAEAMYEGWMPYDMEWWEGVNDDSHVLKFYMDVPNDDYHFWTRVQLATHTYPILKRNPSDEEMTFLAYTPRNLS